MTQERFIEILNDNRHDVYIKDLIKEVNKMSNENINILAENYAGDLIYGEDLDGNHNCCKQLTLIAKAINNGENQEYIDAIFNAPDYYTARRINDIKDMENNYVMHLNNSEIPRGIQNSTFSQTGNIKNTQLPVQGWKLHISATDIIDYYNICSVLLPEFDKNNISYKMVKPERFEHQINSNQKGKAITVYLTPSFNINNFSPNVINCLFNNSKEQVVPRGDKLIGGRTFARYGCFRSIKRAQYLTTSDGCIQYDSRDQLVNFADKETPEDILNFYSNIYNKLNLSNDKKTFLQEYYTMTPNDGKSHAYMTFEINPNNLREIEDCLKENDQYGLSFVADAQGVDGKAYLFVHQSTIPYVSNILDTASRGYSINDIVRPIWDIKENEYEILPQQVEVAKQIAQEIQSNYNGNYISVLQTKNNNFIVKCDSTLNSVFFNKCAERNLAIREVQTNEKSSLKNFWQKITKQNVNAKDITFAPPVSEYER